MADLLKEIKELFLQMDGTQGDGGGVSNGLSKNILEVAFDATKATAGGNNENIKHPLPKEVLEIGMVDKTPEEIDLEYNNVVKETTQRINTVLEERSFIDFYFPNTFLGKRRVCFFENPEISESRSPKYASKAIVARNEPVRMWVGSNARRVKVKFTYTLPHIAHFWRMMGAEPPGFGADVEGGGSTNWQGVLKKDVNGTIEEKTSPYAPDWMGADKRPYSPRIGYKTFVTKAVNKFFGTEFRVNTGESTKYSAGGRIEMTNTGSRGPRFYRADKGAGIEPIDGMSVSKADSPFLETLVRTGWSLNPSDLEEPYLMAAYYTLFALDTIRASVVGDTLNIGPVGPPIVRLRHGVIFNEAPFIVKNFSVDFDKSGGYEVRTLCPRKVVFTLDLEEFRQTTGAQHGKIEGTLPGAGMILDLAPPPYGTNPDRYRNIL